MDGMAGLIPAVDYIQKAGLKIIECRDHFQKAMEGNKGARK
jgi:hypothetical protein